MQCAERPSTVGRAMGAVLVTGLMLVAGGTPALASPAGTASTTTPPKPPVSIAVPTGPLPVGGLPTVPGLLPGSPESVMPTAAARPAEYPPVPVGSKTYFVGDYDTGGFGQWNNCQSVVLNSSCAGVKSTHYSMRLMPTPAARQGPFAGRFEVHPGDKPNFGGGERSEVASTSPGALTHEGDERWYQWSMYVPPDFPTPRGEYFITMQWHAGNTGSPPLAVLVSKNGTVDVGGDGADAQSRRPRTIGPLQPGRWTDYVLHVGFSRDKAKGFVEAWQNGQLTVPRYARQTMVDDENYLKQGIYRRADGSDAVVWLDGLRVTGPGARSVEAPHRPALCNDATPRGTPCTPPA